MTRRQVKGPRTLILQGFPRSGTVHCPRTKTRFPKSSDRGPGLFVLRRPQGPEGNPLPQNRAKFSEILAFVKVHNERFFEKVKVRIERFFEKEPRSMTD